MARKRRHAKHLDKGFMPMAATGHVTEAAPPAKPFRLLDLPTELVLHIVEMAVIVSSKNKPIDIFKAAGKRKHRKGSHGYATAATHTSRLLQPAITRVCRFLRREGLPIFYGKNVFLIDFKWMEDLPLSRWTERRTVTRWLECIGPDNSMLISCLFVRGEHTVAAIERTVLADCPLNKSYMYIRPSDFLQPHERTKTSAFTTAISEWAMRREKILDDKHLLYDERPELTTVNLYGKVAHERIGSGPAVRVMWNEKAKLAAGEVFTTVRAAMYPHDNSRR